MLTAEDPSGVTGGDETSRSDLSTTRAWRNDGAKLAKNGDQFRRMGSERTGNRRKGGNAGGGKPPRRTTRVCSHYESARRSAAHPMRDPRRIRSHETAEVHPGRVRFGNGERERRPQSRKLIERIGPRGGGGGGCGRGRLPQELEALGGLLQRKRCYSVAGQQGRRLGRCVDEFHLKRLHQGR